MNLNHIIGGAIAIASTAAAAYATYAAIKERNAAIALAAEQAAKMQEVNDKIAADRKKAEAEIAAIREEADASKKRSEEFATFIAEATKAGESIDSAIERWKNAQ